MSFLSSLTVYDVHSNKIRLGNQQDGGYIVNQTILDNTQRLVSIGIGGEDNFELQWAEKFPNIPIEAYDGTYPCNNLCHKFPDRINKNIFYVHHNVGFEEKQIPINTIVDSKNNVLLKVDIEGGEYKVFDNFFPSANNLTGLILEIHDLHVPENRYKIRDLITNNFKNLMLFHIHGNSWGGTFDLNLIPHMNDGITIKGFPHVLELTFISKHLVEKFQVDSGQFPVSGLDNSNKHDAPDINLYWVNSI
jgi:hypothetical protein